MACEVCGGSGVVASTACSTPCLIHRCGPAYIVVRPVACGACEKAALSEDLAS